MPKVTRVSGSLIPLIVDEIDTDRIIPARFLRFVSFEGLGEHAFADDRQQDSAHPFDDPRYQGAGILVTGENFGCGSSREHAPQSLMRWGLQGIVAGSFAEIFFGNCLTLGIPAVCASLEVRQELAEAAATGVAAEIDLEASCIRLGDRSWPCEMPEAARGSLIAGTWDVIGQLLDEAEAVDQVAGQLPYLNGFGA